MTLGKTCKQEHSSKKKAQSQKTKSKQEAMEKYSKILLTVDLKRQNQ